MEKLAAVIVPNIAAVIAMPFFLTNYLHHVEVVKSITERRPILHLATHKIVNFCKLDHLPVRNTKKLQYFIEFMYMLIREQNIKFNPLQCIVK